jgi:hypothetical protein
MEQMPPPATASFHGPGAAQGEARSANVPATKMGSVTA